MAAFVLVVGLFNYVLGYLLALALADPPLLGLLSGDFWQHVWHGIKAGLKRQTLPVAGDEDDAMSDEHSLSASLPAIAPVSELPEVWQNLLRDAGLAGVARVGGSSVEGALGVG